MKGEGSSTHPSPSYRIKKSLNLISLLQTHAIGIADKAKVGRVTPFRDDYQQKRPQQKVRRPLEPSQICVKMLCNGGRP